MSKPGPHKCENCGQGALMHEWFKGLRFCPVRLSHDRFDGAKLENVTYKYHSVEARSEATCEHGEHGPHSISDGFFAGAACYGPDPVVCGGCGHITADSDGCAVDRCPCYCAHQGVTTMSKFGKEPAFNPWVTIS